jgi:hypothetical protein
MVWADVVLLLSPAVVYLVVLPLVGGALLLACFRIARVPDLTFLQCWKACLAAVSCGLVLLAALAAVFPGWQTDSTELSALQAGLMCLTQLVALMLFLRRFSLRALLAQATVVLVINLATLSLSLARLS